MAVQSSLKNMVLCLFSVCFICAALLGGVYALTAKPIAQTNANILKASVSAVLPEGGELSESAPITVGGQPSEYYVSTVAGEPVAYAIKSTTVGFGGPLTIMVGIKADGTVYNTSVLSHAETPGLGAKIATEPWFREQFAGKQIAKNGEVVAVSIIKGGAPKGDINAVDAISGATITSQALDATLKIWLGQYKAYIAKCPQPVGNVSETSENQED